MGTLRSFAAPKPNSQAAPQGLGQRSKLEKVVPKMVCWRGLDAGQSRRR